MIPSRQLTMLGRPLPSVPSGTPPYSSRRRGARSVSGGLCDPGHGSESIVTNVASGGVGVEIVHGTVSGGQPSPEPAATSVLRRCCREWSCGGDDRNADRRRSSLLELGGKDWTPSDQLVSLWQSESRVV